MPDKTATFSIDIDGDNYSGNYKGLAIIKVDKKSGLVKFAANGFTALKRNGTTMIGFRQPVNIFITKQNGKANMLLKDGTKNIKPLIDKF